MGLSRRWLKKLEKRAGHNSFLLHDGTTYRYDFDESAGDLFVYCVQLWSGDTPSEAPPILKAIRAARDPEAAMEPFRPEKGTEAGAFLDPIVLIHDHDELDKEA
jgi:hypothetical protein